MRPLDPRSGFADARVGLMLFASYNSDVCRRALLDNRTGVSAEAGKIHCGQLPEQQGGEHFLALTSTTKNIARD
jgi:hypothetical protein